MKRNAVALGASVLALALGAGPAQAAPGATQSVDDTTGAAQVGAVAVNAPVRVASDGDDQAAGATTAGPQTTADSTGGAQVSSVAASAPVRVLSDGDDPAPASGHGSAASGADQSTDDSAAGAQVGSPGVDAPVRVASDGGAAGAPGDTAGTAAGPQTVRDTSGAAQVGSPRAFAPVRVLSGDQSGGDDSTVEAIASELVGDDAGDAGRSTPQETRGLRDDSEPYARPVVDLAPGGGADDLGDGGSGSEVGDVSTAGADAGTLPLTGTGLAALVGMGMSLLSGGAALRRAT
jgi:hypothetical protein